MDVSYNNNNNNNFKKRNLVYVDYNLMLLSSVAIPPVPRSIGLFSVLVASLSRRNPSEYAGESALRAHFSWWSS
jgi:hypothetical protein